MLTRERPRTSTDLPPPAPLPCLTTTFSRRAAIFGAAASTGVLASPVAALPGAPTRPQGPLTLTQAEELDFAALWRSLPMATQARLGAMVLSNEMLLLQIEEDGGFHTTAGDRNTAVTLASDVQAELWAAIWAALPDVMPTVYDEPYPLWQALDERDPPAEIDIRGHGRCPLVKDGWEWFAVTAVGRLKLGGVVDLDSRDDGAPRRWLFWTVADIKAERLRRHPEMTFRGSVS